MQGDLLLAGVASALMRNAKPATGTVTTPPAESGPVTAQFSSEQINQLSGTIASAVESAVSQIQITIPESQITIPSVQANLSDDQLAKLTNAIQSSSSSVKMRQVQNRFLQIPNTTGTTINTLAGGAPAGSYPNIALIDTIQFTENVNLIAIVLSVSMLNTGTEPMGVYAGRVQGGLLNLTSSPDPTIRATDIYLSLLTHNNSTGVTNAPASRTSSIAFSPTSAPVQMKSNESIGIYACSQNIATALLSADLSVFYFSEDMTKNAG
jgi:hypothetical protein